MSLQQLPTEFVERIKQIFPQEDLAQRIATFRQAKPVSLRVNTLKTNESTLLAALESLKLTPTKVNTLPHAFLLPAEQKSRLTQSELHTQGLCYIQNLSSMLPVFILDPQSEEKILDLAAAPGSKTTQLAAAIQNQGWISAVEINKGRFFKLKQNLAQQGVTNVHTYLKDGSTVWKQCPEMFDKVLLDAPCSSESRFSTNEPETYAFWSERKIREMQKKQKRLIFSAFLSLKPGGALLYSTCSFAPEENEQVIQYLVKKFGAKLEIENIQLSLTNLQQGLSEWQGKQYDEAIQRAVRILPTDTMDGFFLCKIRKTASTQL